LDKAFFFYYAKISINDEKPIAPRIENRAFSHFGTILRPKSGIHAAESCPIKRKRLTSLPQFYAEKTAVHSGQNSSSLGGKLEFHAEKTFQNRAEGQQIVGSSLFFFTNIVAILTKRERKSAARNIF